MSRRRHHAAVSDRFLHWEGCINVRDLGGLPTMHGQVTRWRSVIRADTPAKLTAAGWEALQAYGIKTIVSLNSIMVDGTGMCGGCRVLV